MSFSVDISKFVKVAKGNPVKTRNRVLLALFRDIIRGSPVDTGRFRHNWNTNLETPDLNSVDHGPDKENYPNTALSQAQATLANAEGDEVIYFTNNLPYAYALEHGWSGQAPNGMVRVNVARFKKLIAAEAKRLKARGSRK